MIKVDLLNLQDSFKMNLKDNEALTEAVIKDLDSSKFGDVFKILQILGIIKLNPLKHGFADVFVDMKAKIRASCDVCGEETDINIEGAEKFLAKVKRRSKDSRIEHEVDLNREELDEIFLEDGKNLDLLAVIRDAIHVNTPSRIRCSVHLEFNPHNDDKMTVIGDLESIPRFQSPREDKPKDKSEKHPSPFSVLEGLKKNLKH